MINDGIYIFIVIMTCLIYHYNSLLIHLFAINCIYSYVISLKNHLSQNPLFKCFKFTHSLSSVNKFIYIITCYISHVIIINLFWLKHNTLWNTIFYFVFIILNIPYISNIILSHNMFKYIETQKQYIIKNIIATQIINIVNTLGNTHLQKNIIPQEKYVIPLININSLKYLYSLIVNIIILLISSSLQKYSNTYYYYFGKLLFRYLCNGDKYIILDDYHDVNMAKKEIINLIDNNKWEDILKPNSLKALIYIYNGTPKTNNNTFKDIYNMIITIFSLYSLIYVMKCKYVIIIVMSIFIFFEKNTPITFEAQQFCKIFTISINVFLVNSYSSLIIISFVVYYFLTVDLMLKIYDYSKIIVLNIINENKELLKELLKSVIIINVTHDIFDNFLVIYLLIFSDINKLSMHILLYFMMNLSHFNVLHQIYIMLFVFLIFKNIKNINVNENINKIIAMIKELTFERNKKIYEYNIKNNDELSNGSNDEPNYKVSLIKCKYTDDHVYNLMLHHKYLG